MNSCGYDFVIMVKGKKDLVNELVLMHKGMFEGKRSYSIREYGVYGMTVKRNLYATDEKERYFHIFHSVVKEGKDKEKVEDKIERITKFLKEREGTKYVPTDAVDTYFACIMDEKDGTFVVAREKQDVIKRE